jgi:hypothetical protein
VGAQRAAGSALEPSSVETSASEATLRSQR